MTAGDGRLLGISQRFSNLWRSPLASLQTNSAPSDLEPNLHLPHERRPPWGSERIYPSTPRDALPIRPSKGRFRTPFPVPRSRVEAGGLPIDSTCRFLRRELRTTEVVSDNLSTKPLLRVVSMAPAGKDTKVIERSPDHTLVLIKRLDQ